MKDLCNLHEFNIYVKTLFNTIKITAKSQYIL